MIHLTLTKFSPEVCDISSKHSESFSFALIASVYVLETIKTVNLVHNTIILHILTYKIQNTEYRIQNTKYRIQNTEYRIQNTEYRIQNTKYRIQNTEYRIQNTEYRIQNTEYRIKNKE